YGRASRTLFVVHTFGPDHLRLMSVDEKGNLKARPEQYSVNTKDWPNRGPTMAVLSPDGKFLIIGTTFDELPSKTYPDGSLVIWIPHGQTAHCTSSVRMHQTPTASSYSRWAGTARLAQPSSRTRREPLRSTSPSCAAGRIPSSSDMLSATPAPWQPSMETARSTSARS